MLQRVIGPECPKCGCEQSEVVRTFTRWGKLHERRGCSACGHEFAAPASPATLESASMVIEPLRCLACGSDNVFVSSSPLPIRYVKCRDCGHKCKGVERTNAQAKQ